MKPITQAEEAGRGGGGGREALCATRYLYKKVQNLQPQGAGNEGEKLNIKNVIFAILHMSEKVEFISAEVKIRFPPTAGEYQF